jgi:uncharacterized protein DUF5681
VSDEKEPRAPVGREKGYANLRPRPPWKKGESGNPSGKPKNLARLGDLFTQELFKTVPVTMGGQIVNKMQAEVLVSQMVKQAIAKGGTATRIALQFMEDHEAREAAKEERKAKQAAEGSVEIDWDAEKHELAERLIKKAELLQLPAHPTNEDPNG